MKIKFSYLSCLSLLTFGLFTFSGCSESTILGSNLIPGGDKVDVVDSTINNLIVYNIQRPDSTIITGGYQSYGKVIGTISDDAIFGKSYGEAFLQLAMPKDTFRFADNSSIREAWLYLPYSGSYGDENSDVVVDVYQMQEPTFKVDSAYRSYQQMNRLSTVLGTATQKPVNSKDSVYIVDKIGGKDSSIYVTGASLRIKMNATFINMLVNASKTSAFDNDSTFRRWLNGLAIVPRSKSTGKALMYTSVSGAKLSIQTYLNSRPDSTIFYNFPYVASTCAHQNYFERNYSGAEVANFVNTNNPAGDQTTYLQEAPGIYAKLLIPGLENFPQSTINSAELVITEITAGNTQKDIYTQPSTLMLYKYASPTTDSLGYVVDYGSPLSPNPSFGGEKVEINLGGVKTIQYKFNIPRYLQMLLRKQETNYGFKLMAYSSLPIDARRLKAGGSGVSTQNMHLRIIYTKQ
ncbi:hypothetical protein LX64_02060 [Chitinophaga skermanii]|uniref:DUF4270 domain-containing protein n=1 Tax=Chitinophaga skermanii TaxID=331697 RepID=A0A327QTA6_9BACT|nr:DUF4270 family protein [Chitinophaga skermanii]RAJ06932.1 hypothetical protein LX64_02060 [Chitinophaga skermanii]